MPLAEPSQAPWQETALAFPCGADTLLGILTMPQRPPGDIALLIVVGGPQYRAGSHRQFTQLARSVAAAGWPCLRFDVRGMGDSSGRAMGFENLDDDIRAAIDCLQAQAGAGLRVVLWGLCDGASAALMYGARTDPRVAGLCLVNPWVRSEASLARVHAKHYYGQRLVSPDFWRKLLSGGVGVQALRGWLASRRALRQRPGPADAATATTSGDFRVRMEQAFCGFRGASLIALSGEDFTAKEFSELLEARPGWKQATQRPGSQVRHFAGADHTFSDPATDTELRSAVVAWMRSLTTVSRPSAAVSTT